MKLRRRIVRNRHDTDGIWGDLVVNEGLDVDRELRRSISRRIFIATFTAIAVILSSFWFWVHRIDSAQANVPAVVEQVQDSIVGIGCGSYGGTGVAMNIPVPKGYKSAIISAAHVFKKCDKGDTVFVTYQGRDYRGYLAGKDPKGGDYSESRDIALVYVKFKLTGLEPAPEARIGDWSIVVGNPYDHINYVTFGIITDVTKDEYGTDAAVNHGNSGGPIFDSTGRVLGIVSYGEMQPDQYDGNTPGVIDGVVGISYAKRLRLACAQIFDKAPSCPFSY